MPFWVYVIPGKPAPFSLSKSYLLLRRTMAKRIDTASRLIKASAHTIYRAFESADAVVAWLPPHGMTATVFEFVFRENGGYRMRLTYDQPRHAPGKTSAAADEVIVRFINLTPNERIEQAVMFASDDPAFSGEMRMQWILQPAEVGTLVTVRCEEVPEGISAQDHEVGLNSTLSNLAAYAESKT